MRMDQLVPLLSKKYLAYPPTEEALSPAANLPGIRSFSFCSASNP